MDLYRTTLAALGLLLCASVSSAGTLGLHIGSQHFHTNRRHCINLLPCLTVRVRLPGGNEP